MEYHVLNINKLIRDNYAKIVKQYQKEYKDDFEYDGKIDEYLEHLKNSNFNLYKLLIGIMYSDFIKLNRISEDDAVLQLLEQFENINDMDELIDLIEIDSNILSRIKYSPLKYQSLDEKSQIKMLLSCDDQLILKVTPTHILEKLDIFKQCSLDEINKNYEENINDTHEEEIIDYYKNKLEQLHLYNKENFKEIIINMMKCYYYWKKFLQIQSEDYLTIFDEKIVNSFEQLSIDQFADVISEDPDLLEILISEYFYYKYRELELKYEDVKNYVSKKINPKIIKKLKDAN